MKQWYVLIKKSKTSNLPKFRISLFNVDKTPFNRAHEDHGSSVITLNDSDLSIMVLIYVVYHYSEVVYNVYKWYTTYIKSWSGSGSSCSITAAGRLLPVRGLPVICYLRKLRSVAQGPDIIFEKYIGLHVPWLLAKSCRLRHIFTNTEWPFWSCASWWWTEAHVTT